MVTSNFILSFTNLNRKNSLHHQLSQSQQLFFIISVSVFAHLRLAFFCPGGGMDNSFAHNPCAGTNPQIRVTTASMKEISKNFAS
jgi:hypothetical protein